jgi:peptidoglycan/LPS O-acetylase OafA/YrhL
MKHIPTSRPSQRLVELDALRVLAAFSVIGDHYVIGAHLSSWLSSGARFGFLGVNLFFMISGFVIMLSATGSKPFDFVVARIARLYPAFWTAVTLTAVTVLLLQGESAGITWQQYLVNLTMVPEYVGVDSIDGVYWTLQTDARVCGSENDPLVEVVRLCDAAMVSAT